MPSPLFPRWATPIARAMLILLLLGLVSIPGLPIELYPRIAAPQVSVTSLYTGASAEVVESA